MPTPIRLLTLVLLAATLAAADPAAGWLFTHVRTIGPDTVRTSRFVPCMPTALGQALQPALGDYLGRMQEGDRLVVGCHVGDGEVGSTMTLARVQQQQGVLNLDGNPVTTEALEQQLRGQLDFLRTWMEKERAALPPPAPVGSTPPGTPADGAAPAPR